MGNDVTGASGTPGLNQQGATTGGAGTQQTGQQQSQQQGQQQQTGQQQGVQQSSGDDLTKQMEAMKAKYEQDLARLRQSLDRRYASSEQNWKQQNELLSSRLNEVLLSTMDDEDREAYEVELLKQQTQTLQQQLAQQQAEAEQSKAMMSYAQWFNALGVPYEKLNMNSPEEMMQSAWDGLKETMTSMKQKMADLEAKISTQGGQQQQSQQQNQLASQVANQGRTQAQQTFTGKGTAPSGEDVLLQVQKGLTAKYGRQVTLEETFSAIESGAVDINALLQAGNR